MADLNFQNRLQYYGNKLSKSEQKIADFIISHPKEATSYSSIDLARKIGTSNSTVSRFCQKLHYRNYIELQTLLAAENKSEPLPVDAIQRISYYYDQIFSSSSELINRNSLNQFVEQIQSANQILVCGIGSSGLSAVEFSMRLMRMGLMAKAITDSHLMLTQTRRFSTNDLLIAISTSGETQEVIKACTIAKEVGTPICALTKNNQTSLTKLSNITVFASDVGQVNDHKFANSQLSFLFLIDVISYILLLNPEYNENYQKALHA